MARLAAAPAPERGGRSEKSVSLSDLRNLVKAGAIDTVLLALSDLQGRLKGKRYDAGHFLKRVAHDGAEVCAYTLATDVEMSPADGFALTSWETGYQDLTVQPDLATVCVVPWMPRTAVVLGHAVDGGGAPIGVAPRHILHRQLTRLARHGLHPQAGIETEFVLYEGTYAEAEKAGYQGLRPVTTENLDYALDHDPVCDRFFRRLQRALAGAGMPIEAIKTEAGPGQVEVTFPYGSALAACDQHLLFKHAVRTLGSRAGLAPTFMAAPETGRANGLHLHVSLWSKAISQLHAPESDHELSPTGRHAIAGLLDGLPELGPLYAPNVNSYKRFMHGSFAPTTFSWGWDNRTCAVRVVGRGDGLHLEIRVPGADANPYLALSAVLAAIDHGIVNKLPLGAAETGNAYRSGGTLVPTTLNEALAAFYNSALAERAFGTEVVEHYARLAQMELDHHQRLVTDAERQRLLARA
ncbi:glutamine synthetase family protein [Streptomyces ipomoeae]|uniref:Glutamine synthetase catalytic domain protein n=1 Tax=Streptomyces ipomoeae 91-03 TaxID=698759 RepID=L1KYL2_9ACTN|nr:glutamine synthetase family protein [Streptomyces ipomoeae]EKX65428.1 glutamine synthetase catalytic domain protein [Streptomyces ipomoeae 91-03]MDX2694434.1 glutamine synthetase family protein [Streptomyces ipomoeae]MDX2837920.1 glutamine synthetase family protein [Streptomyces ipomoeae]